MRPRPFRSPAVTDAVSRAASLINSPALRTMFLQCATNTLETTVCFRDADQPDTYVITGDIPAMWLRDSAAQVWPFLRFAPHDPRLARMIAGLIRRHARSILLDPYANAFLFDTAQPAEWASDLTEMRPGVHERKYEVDSLCYAIRLSHGYWQATSDLSPFDTTWLDAMAAVLRTWRAEQDHASLSPYRFQRQGGAHIDTLPNDGAGSPVARTGMTWSGFRPSDDRCDYHYLVPSNAFAVLALAWLAELAAAIAPDSAIPAEALALRAEIAAGLAVHAVHARPDDGTPVLAYEVDGLGNANLMDDANVPSLLSLPYLGYCATDDPLYVATRRYILSPRNPHFARGLHGHGIGSPHTPPGRVWPMSIAMQALTSTDDAEIAGCLRMLVDLAAGTGFMHESVDPDNPADYSRPWFAWANTLFGELILSMADRAPEILSAA